MSLGISPYRKLNMLEQQLLPVSCDHETSAPVLICLLGHFLLLKTGREIALRRGGKGEALLGHLSLQNRHRLPRAALLQMLWPASDATLASQALNSLVYSLNQRIGDALGGSGPVIHDEGDYRLNVEAGVAVDVARFDALVRTGDQQVRLGALAAANDSYNGAVSLYRGDLCIDTDIHALVERERLRARYLTLLAQLADYYFSLCDYDACLAHAWRLLACDPCREDAHRLIMRCEVRLGKRAEALHQYRVCVKLLHTEFDAAPEKATTALFEQTRLDPSSI